MHHLPVKTLVVLFLGISIALFSGLARAETLVMQPEQLALSASKPAAWLQFHNPTSEETTLTFDVMRWQQQEDRESLSPSRDLMITPSKVTLKPGETGKVRVGLRLSASWWEEEAFRVMVTQSSPIPDVGDVSAYTAGGRVTRPSSVPVFLLPPGKAEPRLSWSFSRNGQGGVVLRAVNSGKGHAQMNSASLLGPAGESLQMPKMSDFILPGGARSWDFSSQAAAGLWHLIADTRSGPVRIQLELEPDNAGAVALRYED